MAWALVLCALAAPVAAEGDEDVELGWSLGNHGLWGYVPARVDYLEVHLQHADPDDIDPKDIRPFTAVEANRGIRYFATHVWMGPRLDLTYGRHFYGHFSVGLFSPSITTTFSRDCSITHPPTTTLLENGTRETTRFDEGLDCILGVGLRLEVDELVRIRLAYDLEYGLAKMHGGSFFLTQMQGQYSFFLHRLLMDVDFRFPVEDFGMVMATLGLGAVLYRSKVELEQRFGSEEWRMEWIQEKGYVAHLGLRFESGSLYATMDILFFGERSLSLGLGVRL
jgi:hypothetical protein